MKNQDWRKYLDVILNTTQDGFWVVDKMGKMKDFNEAYLKMSGYSKEELLGKKITDIAVYETSKEMIERMIRIQNNGFELFKSSHYRKDGTIFEVEVSVTWVGEIENFICFCRDITKSQQAEQVLLERNILFNKLSSQISGMIFLFKRKKDGSYSMPFATDAIESIFGCTSEDVAEDIAPIFKLIVPKDLPRVIDSIEHAMENLTTWDCEFRVQLPDQAVQWIVGQASPEKMNDGTVIGYGFCIDHTKCKKIQEELMMSGIKYQTLFESSSDAVMMLSEQGFFDCNGATVKMFGCINKEEFCSKHPADCSPEFQICGTDSMILASQHIQEAYKIGSKRFEWVHKRIDIGENFPAEVLLSKMCIEGRDVLQATVCDLTEKKNAEKLLIESQRLSAIGELASGVAHDFNNVLQGILGNMELANMELAKLENNSEVATNYLNVSKKLVQDAVSRVKQLQRFAAKKDSSFEYNSISVYELVNDAKNQTVFIWKDLAQENGLEINITNNCSHDLYVYGNQGELRSVIFNLIKNAAEAMPTGGSIEFEASQDDNFVFLTIIDSGEGMDAEIQKRVFEPFFTTKGYKLGMGMGMTGVLSIIREHRGGIHVVRSVIGEGTTIQIRLPVAEKPIMDLPTIEEEVKGFLEILWVDDDEFLCDLWKDMLEREGHRVDCASNGKEALELLKLKPYEVLVTDIRMPVMNGWDLINLINGKHLDMVRVILTGGGNTDKERIKKHRIEYVLAKPINREEGIKLAKKVLKIKNK